jgi:hypothetical protein
MHDGGGKSCSRYDVKASIEEEIESEDSRKEKIKTWLDGGYQSAGAFWRYVKAAQGLAVGDWKFVAEPSEVKRILTDDKAFKVQEYGRRMRATSGRFFLGMDGEEHALDATMGEIIPSWNGPPGTTHPDANALDHVRVVAETACRAALALYGRLGLIAKETNPGAPYRVALPQIVGPVLDACAAELFGIAGPSSLSLLSWAIDITRYHFRAYADAGDCAVAREASGQFRDHVLATLATMDRLPPRQAQRLKTVVDRLSTQLAGAGRKAAGSDEDVARNLMGILIGSLTATYKAFSDALAIRAALKPHQAPSDSCGPVRDDKQSGFPLYDSIIANTLSVQQRGSLDAVYRKYSGPPAKSGNITLQDNDLVIVWLGGTLEAPDNLFGIGVHKCPGMDMSKAIIEGTLRALTQLTGAEAPAIEQEGELLYFVFPKPSALVELMDEREP